MAAVFGRITSPEPYRVYQRSSDNTACIEISGKLSNISSGAVECRLVSNRASMHGFDWREVPVENGSFVGNLESVPVGGPYSLELRLSGDERTVRVPGILVGDIWVLAGQSNMEGCGKLIDLEKPSRHVNAYYFGDHWGVAKDPLCWFDEATEPAHWVTPDPDERAIAAQRDRDFRDFGGGLGVRFGKDMYKAIGVPVGLLLCAHGGTSLAQWSPKLKDRGCESLYGTMLRRIEVVGGKVAGCLWYQGEADAIDFDGKDYKELTKEFINSLRSDISQPDLPFIYVQLSRFHTWGVDAPRVSWNKVQNDQLMLEKELDNVAFAAAIDGTLTDPIHLDSVSQRRLGSRLSKLARRLVFGENIEIGPRPANFEFLDDSRTVLRVQYDHVNGKLTPSKDIRGFQIEKDDVAQAISRCEVGKDGTSVIITLKEPVPEGSNIWYGRGLYPVVKLVDKEDLAAPVFGPVRLP